MAKLDRLLIITKDLGPPFASGKAARVTDSEIYEIRTRRGTRLFWLYGPPRSIVLLSRLPKMLITEVADITPEAWARAQRQPQALKAAS